MVTGSTVQEGEPRLPAAAGDWGPAGAYLESPTSPSTAAGSWPLT
jgi:hypothetical protein